jgi:hypothetical protein
MQEKVQVIDGCEIIEVTGTWEEVCNFVDNNQQFTFLCCCNTSHGGEALYTKEKLEETTESKHGSTTYTMRGKPGLIRARIRAIQHHYNPQGYGGNQSEPKDIGNGLVEVTYRRSNCCD